MTTSGGQVVFMFCNRELGLQVRNKHVCLGLGFDFFGFVVGRAWKVGGQSALQEHRDGNSDAPEEGRLGSIIPFRRTSDGRTGGEHSSDGVGRADPSAIS